MIDWKPRKGTEETLELLSRHFKGDIDYAIRAIEDYKGGRNYRMAQYICAFYKNKEGDVFLDIRHDSKIRNQRGEALDSWHFGLGAYEHKRILIYSYGKTTGYWQRQWGSAYYRRLLA